MGKRCAQPKTGKTLRKKSIFRVGIFVSHFEGFKELSKFFWCPEPFWISKSHLIRPWVYQSQKMVKKIFLTKNGPNGLGRNFCTPKIDLFGAGRSKFFWPRPKRFQSPRKTFLVIPNSFLGSVGLLESKIADFRPKNRNFWKPIWPKFLHVGVRPAPKYFSELGSSWSISKNVFGFLTQF